MIKLTEISRRVRGPIKSGRKSKTMVVRDIKGGGTEGGETGGKLSEFLCGLTSLPNQKSFRRLFSELFFTYGIFETYSRRLNNRFGRN